MRRQAALAHAILWQFGSTCVPLPTHRGGEPRQCQTIGSASSEMRSNLRPVMMSQR